MNTLTPEQVLDLPLQQPNDAEAATVCDYLIKLLATVWREDEGFSGKRPFGNSSWQYDLYKPLITAGVINGQLDDDGYIDDCDDAAADKLIAEAIETLRAEHVRVRMEGTTVVVVVEGKRVIVADHIDAAGLADSSTTRELRLIKAVLDEALTTANRALTAKLSG